MASEGEDRLVASNRGTLSLLEQEDQPLLRYNGFDMKVIFEEWDHLFTKPQSWIYKKKFPEWLCGPIQSLIRDYSQLCVCAFAENPLPGGLLPEVLVKESIAHIGIPLDIFWFLLF